MTIVCCTSHQDRSVFLFNNIAFKLNDGEELVKIDFKKKEIFNSHYDKKSNQIPLFKCIKADNYLIFIGIPFNTSLKELSIGSLSQTLNLLEGDSVNYVYKKYISKKESITVYTQDFSDNIVYVLTVSNSVELSDSLFNMETLSNRFKK